MTTNVWNTLYPDANGEILIGNSAGRPSAANITGDANITITNGAGSIQIDNNVSGGDLIKISSSTASGSSSINFTNLSSTYFLYIIRLDNVQPATNTVELLFRTSTDNGSNFDDGASDYAWNRSGAFSSGNAGAGADGADSAIPIFGLAGDEMTTVSNKKGCGVVYLFNPSSAKYTFIVSQGFYSSVYPDDVFKMMGGYRLNTTAVNAVRFVMDSGNIATGKFTLYGMKAS